MGKRCVVLKIDDFIEMKRALAAAWQFRNEQLSNLDGNDSSNLYSDKINDDLNIWFELDKKTDSAMKPVIIRDPDGSWTNADITVKDDIIEVRPNYSRPFKDE